MVTSAKVVLDRVLGHHGTWGLMEFNSDLNVIFTAVVFIMGLVLGGTLTDFKEAERLPGEIACQLEIIEDWLAECVEQQRAHGEKDRPPGLDGAATLAVVLNATDEIIRWFQSAEKRSEPLFTAVKQVDDLVKTLATYPSLKGVTVRIYGDLNALRKALSRAYTISRTEFLGSAYTLFEFFIVGVFALLLVCRFKSAVTASVITGFMSLTYWYLYRLIRDVDNPFGYSQGFNEVSLHLVVRYRDRLASRLAQGCSSI